MQKTRKVFLMVLVILIIVIGIIVIRRHKLSNESLVQSGANSKNKVGYELLGGANSLCINAPFLVNGKDLGYHIGTQLGDYKEGLVPQYGPDKEAEVTADPSGVITVKFHPTTPYTADGSARDNQYWLYVGLVYPYHLGSGNYNFSGCGYDGLRDLPALPVNAHFKGEFKWISGESQPPFNSGFGNTLLGGQIAYNFPDGHREIVGVDDFGTPPNDPWPASLNRAKFSCSDWWHDLQWSDWYDPKKADQWQEFDIDVTSTSQQAISASQKCAGRRNLGDAASTKIMGLFVGPEYGTTNGGESVFELKNLRIEEQ